MPEMRDMLEPDVLAALDAYIAALWSKCTNEGQPRSPINPLLNDMNASKTGTPNSSETFTMKLHHVQSGFAKPTIAMMQSIVPEMIDAGTETAGTPMTDGKAEPVVAHYRSLVEAKSVRLAA